MPHTKQKTERQSLIEDFTFTSLLDDYIDRAAYFGKCWPNSEHIRTFTIKELF
jgi:hypothetical protein